MMKKVRELKELKAMADELSAEISAIEDEIKSEMDSQNVDEMIGDYVAIGITNLTIFNTREEADCFKGVHAGYTKDELLIPLIVFDSKK